MKWFGVDNKNKPIQGKEMFNFKKSALVIFALSSGMANAGTMGCEPGDVTVPCANTAWDVGVTALNLRPGFDADQTYFSNYFNAQNHIRFRDESFDWNWAFKLEGSYHFNTGNDVNVNWYHFDNETSKTYQLGSAFGVTYEAPLTDNIKWDAVNFEFGQDVDFGERKNIRFHGGAQYARIESHAVLSNFDNVANSSIGQTMKFDGFGPRGGMDMSYQFMDGFGIYANVAGAVLVGTSKFDSAVLTPNQTRTTSGSKDAVVPEVEGKIGAKYSMQFAQGQLSIDGGWMWINYFNPLHSAVATLGLVDFLPNVNASLGQVKETDFSMNGPYVGLKWVGNV